MRPIRSVVHCVASLSAVVFVVVATAACSGFSPEDAQERCDQEQTARAGGGCFTDVTYDACTAAYEQCGDEVDVVEGCPPRYTCPE